MRNEKIDGAVASLAAVLVLFTAMIDPRLSVILAAASLLGLAIFHFARSRNDDGGGG